MSVQAAQEFACWQCGRHFDELPHFCPECGTRLVASDDAPSRSANENGSALTATEPMDQASDIAEAPLRAFAATTDTVPLSTDMRGGAFEAGRSFVSELLRDPIAAAAIAGVILLALVGIPYLFGQNASTPPPQPAPSPSHVTTGAPAAPLPAAPEPSTAAPATPAPQPMPSAAPATPAPQPTPSAPVSAAPPAAAPAEPAPSSPAPTATPSNVGHSATRAPRETHMRHHRSAVAVSPAASAATAPAKASSAAPAQGVSCVLPDGQVATMSRADCRAKAGVVFQN